MEPTDRSYADDEAHSDLNTGLEESMCRLGLGSGSEDWEYPKRLGEQDCSYYIRTGHCGYGVRCRYNHPRNRDVVNKASWLAASDHPEHVSQPVCQDFLKTGTCRFGAMCKYCHLRKEGGSVSLNYYGYPLRQGEKECPYYAKTGKCKFGSLCKFHHPQPVDSFVPPPPPPPPPPAVYPIVQRPLVPSPQQYPSLDSFQVGGPLISPSAYTPRHYGPVYLSPNIVPLPGWIPYLTPLNPGGQQTVQAQLSCELPNKSFPPMSTHSAHSQKECRLPERPGQSVCHYYIKTGVCKFGSMCRYHHPPNSNCVLSPLGLPLRPGAQTCPRYAQHGTCKFGRTCKYDHPAGTLSCIASASSISDAPVTPYPAGFSFGRLAPSISYPQLQPYLIISPMEHAMI